MGADHPFGSARRIDHHDETVYAEAVADLRGGATEETRDEESRPSPCPHHRIERWCFENPAKEGGAYTVGHRCVDCHEPLKVSPWVRETRVDGRPTRIVVEMPETAPEDWEATRDRITRLMLDVLRTPLPVMGGPIRYEARGSEEPLRPMGTPEDSLLTVPSGGRKVNSTPNTTTEVPPMTLDDLMNRILDILLGQDEGKFFSVTFGRTLVTLAQMAHDDEDMAIGDTRYQATSLAVLRLERMGFVTELSGGWAWRRPPPVASPEDPACLPGPLEGAYGSGAGEDVDSSATSATGPAVGHRAVD